MEYRVIVHLVNNTYVVGKAADLTDEEVEKFKETFAELAGNSGAWQVNITLENDSWGIFPKESVLWVELEKVE